MKQLFMAMSIYALALGYYQYQLIDARRKQQSAEQALAAEMMRKPIRCPRESYRWITQKT